MGRLEDRRLRELERRAEQAAWQAATMRLPNDDLFVLAPYGERAIAADSAGLNRPRPTAREQQALNRWRAEYERAYLEGWGRPDPPPGLDDFG